MRVHLWSGTGQRHWIYASVHGGTHVSSHETSALGTSALCGYSAPGHIADVLTRTRMPCLFYGDEGSSHTYGTTPSTIVNQPRSAAGAVGACW